jgi:hypothetical protein
MRGTDTFTESLFTMRKLEDFIPAEHPLRVIRKMANTALEKMSSSRLRWSDKCMESRRKR